MKMSMFHLMPYRDLPGDFEKRHSSVWITPPWGELADAATAGKYYNWTFDELLYAAEAGLDGICVNEHHQNAYGFMPSPNVMGSVLARLTNHLDVAIVQMGSTVPLSNPPIRVAEEYAMLDCISGGRLVAGMPLGSPMDAIFCYGLNPIEIRERFYEAHDLVLKAWRADQEIFAWNGKYFQLPMVNLWPRPIQQPAPPVWVPGLGSASTWEFCARHDHCYCFLSFWGNRVGKTMMDGFWEFADARGLDRNPFRAGFLQTIVVGETDADAERTYYDHIRYFYDKCLHIPSHFQFPAGYQDYGSLVRMKRNAGTQKRYEELRDNVPNFKFGDFVEDQLVIGGSPASVRDQLKEALKNLHVGNLMVLLHIGDMPPEVTRKNIDLFANEVLPYFKDYWGDGYENRWWPKRLLEPKETAAAAVAAAGA